VVPYVVPSKVRAVSQIDKLIDKARTNPKNLRFKEFCTLCEHFDMVKRKTASGHAIYKRVVAPKFSLSIQDNNGKAIPYQVRQLLDKVDQFGLYEPEEE
jgi:hypothetical protein